jgi:hypothetical protein
MSKHRAGTIIDHNKSIDQDYYENHYKNLPSQQQKRWKEDQYYKDRIVNNTQIYIATVQEKVGKSSSKGTVHKGLVLESPARTKFQHILESD